MAAASKSSKDQKRQFVVKLRLFYLIEPPVFLGGISRVSLLPDSYRDAPKTLLLYLLGVAYGVARSLSQKPAFLAVGYSLHSRPRQKCSRKNDLPDTLTPHKGWQRKYKLFGAIEARIWLATNGSPTKYLG